MANVTLLHRDRQEEDYVGGKRQNLMTLVYNALYQQVDYSYRQNGQLSQMGELSLSIGFVLDNCHRQVNPGACLRN